MQTPSTVIENVEQLKAYLQVALQLEHATIPPYLTAAYSANIEANKPSIDIIRTVAKEEMLHLTLAANLLNAIGGKPNLISPDFVPSYPTHLPTGQDDFDVSIGKLSNDSLKTFLDIERPASVQPEQAEIVQRITKIVPISGDHIDKSMLENENPLVPITKVGNNKYELHYNIALVSHNHLTANRRSISEAGDSLVPRVPANSSAENSTELHYWSIGEFYKAIHLGFVELANKMQLKDLFIGDPKRQVDKSYFSAGGKLIVVTDLRCALMAIDFIAGQGEGSNNRVYDSEGELAHYYRFDQIQKGQYYRDPNKDGAGDEAGHPQGGKFPVDMDSVFPVKTDAKVADYHGHPELEENALLFNGQYKRFLEKLNTAFNGHPELLDKVFFAEMARIKDAMERLIHNPIPGTGENAAPSFEMDQFKYPPAPADSPASTPSLQPQTLSRPDPFENFLFLSVQLCGISRFDLLGTGYARRYFETVESIVGRDVLHRLLDAFAALPAPPARGAFQAAIANHPEFGPIARNIIKLWYTATWFQLPSTWRDNFGARPEDRTFVPYPYAYAESLLGPAVGAHPAGAKPTGHQSWALPPVYLPIPTDGE